MGSASRGVANPFDAAVVCEAGIDVVAHRNSRTIGAWQSCGGVVGVISKDDVGVARDPVCFSCLLWQLLGIHNIFQFGHLGEYHPTNHRSTITVICFLWGALLRNHLIIVRDKKELV